MLLHMVVLVFLSSWKEKDMRMPNLKQAINVSLYQQHLCQGIFTLLRSKHAFIAGSITIIDLKHHIKSTMKITLFATTVRIKRHRQPENRLRYSRAILFILRRKNTQFYLIFFLFYYFHFVSILLSFNLYYFGFLSRLRGVPGRFRVVPGRFQVGSG